MLLHYTWLRFKCDVAVFFLYFPSVLICAKHLCTTVSTLRITVIKGGVLCIAVLLEDAVMPLNL
jgi:hypothetical protein